MKNKYDDIMKKLAAYFLPQHIEVESRNIDSLEKELANPLPSDFRLFLVKHGISGLKYWAVFPSLKDASIPDGGVEVFYGIHPGERCDLARAWRGMHGRIPPAYLPFAEIAGGLLCIGLAGENTGKILAWDREEESAEPEKNLKLIAHSFDGFMKSLVPFEVGNVPTRL